MGIKTRQTFVPFLCVCGGTLFFQDTTLQYTIMNISPSTVIQSASIILNMRSLIPLELKLILLKLLEETMATLTQRTFRFVESIVEMKSGTENITVHLNLSKDHIWWFVQIQQLETKTDVKTICLFLKNYWRA